MGGRYGAGFVMCPKYGTNLTCLLSKLKTLDIGKLARGWHSFLIESYTGQSHDFVAIKNLGFGPFLFR